ncbi:unnamed protein product, partial [Ectocarpus sp. 12 AP-2014]
WTSPSSRPGWRARFVGASRRRCRLAWGGSRRKKRWTTVSLGSLEVPCSPTISPSSSSRPTTRTGTGCCSSRSSPPR